MEKWEKDFEAQIARTNCFAHTQKMYWNNQKVAEAVRHSVNGQRIITESDHIPQTAYDKSGDVRVVYKKTLEAVHDYPHHKIAVLNFACATIPGGGHPGCGNTQEDSLVRETTLYPCISIQECMDKFYMPHKELDPIGNADMIYTPDVLVLKQELNDLPENEWRLIDVITMAAPNISGMKSKPDDHKLKVIFENCFRRIMEAASNADADVLILGAFGCGEFGNDPVLVASAAADVLSKMRHKFETVVFAIKGKKKTQYRIFDLILDRYMNSK